jgi:hypothetical protein
VPGNQNQEVLWWNRAGEAGEASEIAKVDEVNEDAEVLRADYHYFTEDFRGIQVLEFSFILMLWNNLMLVESWNIMFNFRTLLLLRPVDATFLRSMYLMKLKCPNRLKPLSRHHNCTKLQILLPPEPFIFIHFNMRHPVG